LGTLEQRRRRAGYAALTPALLILVLILAYPIVDSMLLSLQDLRAAGGTFEGSFIGLSNYQALLGDSTFGAALWATAYFTAIEVAAVVLLALGVALLLVHPYGRFGIFRIVLLLPWAIAPVANAVLWKWILHANYGILNTLLVEAGLIDRNIVWLGTARMALHTLLAVDIWKSVPFIAVLLLAAAVPVAYAQNITILAAASLKEALDEVDATYQKRGGEKSRNTRSRGSAPSSKPCERNDSHGLRANEALQ